MPEGEKRPSKRTCQLAESRLPRQWKRSANLKRRTSPRIMARIRTTTQAASLRLCPWLPQVLPHAALPDETASSVFLELSTLPGQASMPVKNRLRETRLFTFHIPVCKAWENCASGDNSKWTSQIRTTPASPFLRIPATGKANLKCPEDELKCLGLGC